MWVTVQYLAESLTVFASVVPFHSVAHCCGTIRQLALHVIRRDRTVRLDLREAVSLAESELGLASRQVDLVVGRQNEVLLIRVVDVTGHGHFILAIIILLARNKSLLKSRRISVNLTISSKSGLSSKVFRRRSPVLLKLSIFVLVPLLGKALFWMTLENYANHPQQCQ